MELQELGEEFREEDVRLLELLRFSDKDIWPGGFANEEPRTVFG